MTHRTFPEVDEEADMQHGTTKDEGHAIRGIWQAPHLDDGYPVFVAVDSKGHKVAEIVVRRGITPSRARKMLAEVLNAADPLFRLKLVTPAEHSEQSA